MQYLVQLKTYVMESNIIGLINGRKTFLDPKIPQNAIFQYYRPSHSPKHNNGFFYKLVRHLDTVSIKQYYHHTQLAHTKHCFGPQDDILDLFISKSYVGRYNDFR